MILEELYTEYLNNKKVVIVGPSWNMKGSKQSLLIDSYDVVVRMNLGYRFSEKQKQDMGTKTDIYYCAMSNYYFNKKTFQELLYYQKNIQWIKGTGQHKKSLERAKAMKGYENIKFLNVKKNIFKTFLSKLSLKPTTGIISICDLLSYNIKELYVVGMTFYDKKFVKNKSNYYYRRYSERSIGSFPVKGHDMKKELKIFINLYKNDSRIKCDKVLMNIIKYRDR